MRVLVMIDMQNDFITGPLGSKEAQEVLARVVKGIGEYADKNHILLYTMDTHFTDYEKTLEGQRLPVPHCIPKTEGWKMPTELIAAINDTDFNWFDVRMVRKASFGSTWLPSEVDFLCQNEELEEIIIFGLCTDICVFANAVVLRTYFKDTPITVLADWCAGTTQENHELAIKAMKMLNIDAE